MREIVRVFMLAVGATLVTGAGCADAKRRDCWFENSTHLDNRELLWTPADPLLDLWTLPYNPCTFDPKPEHSSGMESGRQRE